MAKKKLKKLLKKALPLAALAAGATMLGRRRQNNEFLKTEGGNLSILPQAKRMMNIAGKMSVPVDVNANPREIDAIVKSYGIDTRADNFGLPKPKASILASPGLNTGAFDMFKDGGKVVKGETRKKAKKKIGIQIRGFGKARKR